MSQTQHKIDGSTYNVCCLTDNLKYEESHENETCMRIMNRHENKEYFQNGCTVIDINIKDEFMDQLLV